MTTKPIAERIRYFTRKVTEYGAIHIAHKKPKWYRGRYERLIVYKARMHELIQENLR